MSASGSATLANTRLSLVNGTAFVDFSAAGTLTPYLNHKLTLTDSAGKKATGYIHHDTSDDPFVQMTYAASGSSGIAVTDNDNIDFGTCDFTLRWKGALPDWTPSSNSRFLSKRNTTGNGYDWYTSSDGLGRSQLYTGVFSANPTTSFGVTDGEVADIALVIVRETASTAGSWTYYVNGTVHSTSFITAAAPVSLSNAASLQILGLYPLTGARYSGICHAATLFNRALSAAEVLSLYQNGIAEADKWGSQTALTSGTLTVGKKYRINIYVSDDDFTNVGAASNASGVEFMATGTTPTKWTNSSSLVQLGATLALEPEGIGATNWTDSSDNGLDASYPAAGYSVYPDGTGVRITSTPGGSTYNWASIEAGFNYNDASGYSYSIEVHSSGLRRRILRLRGR